MRLKLVFLASILAAVVGAGAAIAIVISVFSSADSIIRPGLIVASTYLLPILAIFFASMFVYRHTARRRRLQAALTVIVSLILTLAIFLATSMLTSRSAPQAPEPKPKNNVG